MRLLALTLLALAAGASHAQSLAPAAPAVPAALAIEVSPEAAPVSFVIVEVDEADVPAEIVERIDTDKRFGIGTGSAFFTYGLSGTYDVNETITAEAIVGFFSSLSSIGGRVWYRFNRNEGYDLYAHGGVSYLSFGDVIDESAIGVAGGAGVEIGLPQVLDNPDFPPIFINLDIGIGFSTFDVYDGFSAFGGGGGIHFRF